jgi:hypothetical protein
MKNQLMSRFSVLLLVLGVLTPSLFADDWESFSAGLTQTRLQVGEADHLYSIKPDKGRVLIVKQARLAGPDERDSTVVTVLDGQGQLIFGRAPSQDIPEIRDSSILKAVLRTPDRLVVTDYGAVTGILYEYDLTSGDLIRAIRSPAKCFDLHGDDEGTLWCLGADLDKARARRQDFNLVYRFGPDGELLGSSLQRAEFPPSPLPWSLRDLDSGFLTDSDGRVRLLLPAIGEILTFTPDGAVSERMKLPEWPPFEGSKMQSIVRYAVAPDGSLVSLRSVGDASDPDSWQQSLFQVAANRTAWAPLAGASPTIPLSLMLVGADSAGLIFFEQRSWSLVYHPLPAEAPRG